MQKQKTIPIEGRTPVTVRELSVRQIREILDHPEKLTDTQYLTELLAMCTDLTLAALDEMYPSELDEIYTGFAEINAAFLDRVRAILASPAAARMIDGLIDQISTRVSAVLSRLGTAIPSLTDTNGSESALPNPSDSGPNT